MNPADTQVLAPDDVRMAIRRHHTHRPAGIRVEVRNLRTGSQVATYEGWDPTVRRFLRDDMDAFADDGLGVLVRDGSDGSLAGSYAVAGRLFAWQDSAPEVDALIAQLLPKEAA